MSFKRPWQSKTIGVNLGIIVLVGLLSKNWQGFREAMCGNTEFVLSALALINMMLRKLTWEPITMKKITPLFLLFLAGCSGIPQKLDPDRFYRRDLPICIKDVGCYEGVAVVPQRDHYEFEVAPKGDAAVDMLVLDSCHREFTREGSEKSALDFFFKIFGKKREGYKIQYTVAPGLEDDGDCSVRINTFERDKGRHAWSVIRFQHPKYKLPATVFCNGEVRNETGVSVCQSKVGLTQQIKFKEAVMIETDKGCELPKRKETGLYEWQISHGECGYTIRNQAGDIHDLLTIGYTGLLVREVK